LSANTEASARVRLVLAFFCRGFSIADGSAEGGKRI
jgi:hypothetical protein